MLMFFSSLFGPKFNKRELVDIIDAAVSTALVTVAPQTALSLLQAIVTARRSGDHDLLEAALQTAEKYFEPIEQRKSKNSKKKKGQ